MTLNTVKGAGNTADIVRHPDAYTDSARTSQQVYEELKVIREPYLQRGIALSSFGIRSLLAGTEGQDTSGVQLSVGYNTRGPQLLNHVCNIYMLTLFPPHRSFHKLELEEDLKESILKSEDNPNGMAPADLIYKLSRWESRSRKIFEKTGCRRAGLLALKLLIQTGNALFVYPDRKRNKKSKAQVYAMDEYVIRTDLDGNLLEVITLDSKSLLGLPPELRAVVAKQLNAVSFTDMRDKTVDLYTHLQLLTTGDWLMHQEIEGQLVPKSKKVIKEKDMRYIPLGWNKVRREMWARGLMEDYAPVFHAVEVLNEALITGAAITLDFKFLVEPASPTDIDRLNNSATGTYHFGRKDDISLIEKAKSGDINSIDILAQRLEKILDQAFLWYTPRDSERTTAEETRAQAQKLQQSHGGNFGNLAEDFQHPIALLNMQEVDPKFSGSKIDPLIITGLDALGRVSVNENIAAVFQDMAPIAQYPQELLEQLGIKWQDLFKTLCAGRDVDSSQFSMTDAEIKDRADAAHQQQLELQQQQGAQPQPGQGSPDVAAQPQ